MDGPRRLPRKTEPLSYLARLPSSPEMGRLLRGSALALLAIALTACSLGAAPASGSPTSVPTAAANEAANDILTRALQAHKDGKVAEATVLYYQVLAKDPKNKFAFFNLGVIAHFENRLVAAESFYRLALEQDPKMATALYNLAIVRQVSKDYTQARDLYKQLIAIEPNNAPAHFNLGVVLRALGSNAEADQEFATAHRLDPKLVAPSGSPLPSPTK